MITRMEICFRSKQQTGITPKVFTVGGFNAVKNGTDFMFDFEESEASFRHEDGYLYVDCLLKNYDENVDKPQEMVDPLMRELVKEDFSEIYYECYEDAAETQHIDLIPLNITFYDYSTEGDGAPIVVGGNGFTSLEGNSGAD